MKGILGLLRLKSKPAPGEAKVESMLFTTAFAGLDGDAGPMVPWEARAVEVGTARLNAGRGTKLLQGLWSKDKHMHQLDKDAIARRVAAVIGTVIVAVVAAVSVLDARLTPVPVTTTRPAPRPLSFSRTDRGVWLAPTTPRRQLVRDRTARRLVVLAEEGGVGDLGGLAHVGARHHQDAVLAAVDREVKGAQRRVRDPLERRDQVLVDHARVGGQVDPDAPNRSFAPDDLLT